MKNLDDAISVLEKSTENILIAGGECSGKSYLLKLCTAFMLPNVNMLAMSNDSGIRTMVEEYPDSTYFYLSKNDEISHELINNAEQSLVVMEGAKNIEKELPLLDVSKRYIMTYNAQSIDEVPQYLRDIFKCVIVCNVNPIDKERTVNVIMD